MGDGPVVRTVNLTKTYGDFTALDNLSIELNRGEILGFIGPNGAGKTTTIKILVGLAEATVFVVDPVDELVVFKTARDGL